LHPAIRAQFDFFIIYLLFKLHTLLQFAPKVADVLLGDQQQTKNACFLSLLNSFDFYFAARL